MTADQVPKAEVARDPAPTAPRTRDEVVQENRRRREQEPAAAPIETDGEAGNVTGRHGGDPLPRDAAGRPHDPADIPAGPGDAGAQSTPSTLPEELQRDRGGWGRVIAILAIGIAIALGIAVLV